MYGCVGNLINTLVELFVVQQTVKFSFIPVSSDHGWTQIYMARLEQQILDTVGLVLYKRFIDDIFFIWEGNYIDLLDFISKLNNLAPTIKLTSSISQEKVVFLDMEVCHENGRLTIRPYQKPLNRYLYLPFTSYHPSHSKKSFIKAELLRYILSFFTLRRNSL